MRLLGAQTQSRTASASSASSSSASRSLCGLRLMSHPVARKMAWSCAAIFQRQESPTAFLFPPAGLTTRSPGHPHRSQSLTAAAQRARANFKEKEARWWEGEGGEKGESQRRSPISPPQIYACTTLLVRRSWRKSAAPGARILKEAKKVAKVTTRGSFHWITLPTTRRETHTHAHKEFLRSTSGQPSKLSSATHWPAMD